MTTTLVLGGWGGTEMALAPLIKTDSQEFSLYQTRLKSVIDPLLSSSFLNGVSLKGVQLVVGSTTINHNLDRPMNGWVITDINGVADVYRDGPMTNNQLVLASNAAVSVGLWVF